ncbi:hypothetical protein [Kingella oralis]|jgi:hypothetical protein|uniref:hypothetical protein n=1 Tax=Kingella oralis TaxID=505 RepID=UPI0025913507|nr:hypothetical protein [Kingella oralis]
MVELISNIGEPPTLHAGRLDLPTFSGCLTLLRPALLYSARKPHILGSLKIHFQAAFAWV